MVGIAWNWTEREMEFGGKEDENETSEGIKSPLHPLFS